MDFGWLVGVLIFLFIMSFVMNLLGTFGLNPAALVFAWRATRRIRTEVEPRDHFDRWVHGHRRSAMANKPRNLKYILTTGDQDVPRRFHGWVKGLEAWRSYYIIFIKSRRWSWSVPHIIDQSLCSDINRKHLWVDSRGFSSNGPVRIPIPVLGGTEDIERHLLEHGDGFRSSFEGQLYYEITEDMAWSIANGMAPPLMDRGYIAQSEHPSFQDREFISEENATGG
ncbi:MAG: hypothetical protein KAJ19_10925 [Gammaproteobacteria bacterium]|nr:hypothetical protein [Gammaproteobacteria bacterium]